MWVSEATEVIPPKVPPYRDGKNVPDRHRAVRVIKKTPHKAAVVEADAFAGGGLAQDGGVVTDIDVGQKLDHSSNVEDDDARGLANDWRKSCRLPLA